MTCGKLRTQPTGNLGPGRRREEAHAKLEGKRAWWKLLPLRRAQWSSGGRPQDRPLCLKPLKAHSGQTSCSLGVVGPGTSDRAMGSSNRAVLFFIHTSLQRETRDSRCGLVSPVPEPDLGIQ